MLNKKGFTLIELLIVISIIGLLSSIVLVGLGNFRSRGRDARRIADLRSVQNMLELYFTRNSQYPCNVPYAGMVALITGGNIGVNNVPNDPLGGAATYLYAATPVPVCLNYVLGATLEDGTHEALRNDADGVIYGVDCGEPPDVYCVSF